MHMGRINIILTNMVAFGAEDFQADSPESDWVQGLDEEEVKTWLLRSTSAIEEDEWIQSLILDLAKITLPGHQGSYAIPVQYEYPSSYAMPGQPFLLGCDSFVRTWAPGARSSTELSSRQLC